MIGRSRNDALQISYISSTLGSQLKINILSAQSPMTSKRSRVLNGEWSYRSAVGTQSGHWQHWLTLRGNVDSPSFRSSENNRSIWTGNMRAFWHQEAMIIYRTHSCAWSHLAFAPSLTTLWPSFDIILPESSQMMNLVGIVLKPLMKTFCNPFGHDDLDK